MAQWPDADELAQILNVENVEDWSTTLDRVMAAAIERVKRDVGVWDEEPDDMLAQAALRMAELLSSRPEITGNVRADAAFAARLSYDPTYQRLLFGHRRTFGVA